MTVGDEQQPPEGQPSLELPKLAWRRKPRSSPREAATPTVPEPAPAPAPSAEATVEEPRAAPLAVEAPEVEAEPRVPRERGPGGMLAAVVTGLVVGLGIVGLTWASLRGCEAVQGTSSCGDSGYGLLFVILAVMIVVGALLLRSARVAEPGSTSFLAVGLTSVLALLFLVDSLLDRSMVVVIPLISAATYAAAHWVTRTFIEPADLP
jgi:hypothetical protein